jgi:ABC-type methionine transport system ATPase subunit
MIPAIPASETEDRKTEQRVRIRIPRALHQEPVISQLVSHYQLTVNITAAVLGANAKVDGWFDLQLKGTQMQIQAALTYLAELDLEIWPGEESDGW